MNHDHPEGLNVEKILQFDGSRFAAAEIPLVDEIFLRIVCDQRLTVVAACAGHHLEELAVGFLRSDGYLRAREDIEELTVSPDRTLVRVTTRYGEENDHHGEEKGDSLLFAGGGRGRKKKDMPQNLGEIAMSLPPRHILRWMDDLLRRSVLHNASHGTHCSALADKDGIIVSREDIGRHNTIDMIGGRMLLDGWDGADKILLTTGRISSEMVHKVWILGIPVIVTRSAPTSAALRLLEKAGITLVGYVRNGQMNIYTHSERVDTA